MTLYYYLMEVGSMRGLRTQEGSDFENFFKIVQEEAKSLGGVFFSETGEGREKKT